MLEHWLQWMLISSVQLALLAMIAGIVIVVFRSISSQGKYLILLLVFLRALLPASFGESAAFCRPFLKRNMQQEVRNEPHPASLSAETADYRESGLVCSPHTSEGVIPTKTVTLIDRERQLDGASRCFSALVSFLPTVRTVSTWDLFLVWLFGVLCCWGTVVSVYLNVHRRLKEAEPVERGPLADCVRDLCSQLSIRRRLRVVLSRYYNYPFIIGVLHPKIVLPARLAEASERGKLASNILLHELIHLRRHDIFFAWLIALVQSLFWFHPLLWWAGYRLRHWRELACDETVLNSKRTDVLDYAQTLLDTLRLSRGKMIASVATLGILEKHSQFQQRFEKVMDQVQRPKRSGMKEFLFITVFAFFFFLAGIFAFSRLAEARNHAFLETPFQFRILASRSDPVEADLIRTVLENPDSDFLTLTKPTGKEKGILGAAWMPISDFHYERLKGNPDCVFRPARSLPVSGKSRMEVLLLVFEEALSIDVSLLTRLEERSGPKNHFEILFTLNDEGGERMERLTEMYAPKTPRDKRRLIGIVRGGTVRFSVAIVNRFGKTGSICFEKDPGERSRSSY